MSLPVAPAWFDLPLAQVSSRVSGYDLGIIGAYLLFLASMGWIFRRFNKGSTDYFAGGCRPVCRTNGRLQCCRGPMGRSTACRRRAGAGWCCFAAPRIRMQRGGSWSSYRAPRLKCGFMS